jgi:hypothetical protein
VRRQSAEQAESLANSEHELARLRVRYDSLETELEAANQQMRDYTARVRSRSQRWLDEINLMLPMIRTELEARDRERGARARSRSPPRSTSPGVSHAAQTRPPRTRPLARPKKANR